VISTLNINEVKDSFKCNPIIVNKDTSIQAVVELLLGDPINRNIYVVDKEDHFIGTITLPSLLEKICPMEFHSNYQIMANTELVNRYLAKSSREIMTRCSDDSVNEEDTIASAFHKMRTHNLTQMPIINSDRKITSIFHIDHILNVWYQKNYLSNPITDSLYWE